MAATRRSLRSSRPAPRDGCATGRTSASTHTFRCNGPKRGHCAGYEPAAGASARWLLLIETPADSAAADPLAGDTGKLLDNMLRAAGLPNSARAAWVPVHRLASAAGPDSGEPGPALQISLSALVQAEKPDVLLIMGRLAAQALLQTAEPLGKLRGQKYLLAGVPAFVTYDAAYLLRSLPDKARAWDDLCLAQQPAPNTGRS